MIEWILANSHAWFDLISFSMSMTIDLAIIYMIYKVLEYLERNKK